MEVDKQSGKKSVLFDLIDRAPFAGKFFLKEVYGDYITSPDEQKTRRTLGAIAVFSSFSAAHFIQSAFGLTIAQGYAQDIMTQGPDVMNVGFLAIDAVYAGTMAAVGLRQAAHVPRFVGDYNKWRTQKDVIPEGKRVPKRRERIVKARDMLTAYAVTVAGQAACIASAVLIR